MKVRSYVIETPVQEDVRLRSETVHVERRPVDRALEAGENAFQDRTIEATATSEEAVVSKEARVTGEVLLKKDVGERVETVTDKVRSTKVEVEDNRVGLADRTGRFVHEILRARTISGQPGRGLGFVLDDGLR